MKAASKVRTADINAAPQLSVRIVHDVSSNAAGSISTKLFHRSETHLTELFILKLKLQSQHELEAIKSQTSPKNLVF